MGGGLPIQIINFENKNQVIISIGGYNFNLTSLAPSLFILLLLSLLLLPSFIIYKLSLRSSHHLFPYFPFFFHLKFTPLSSKRKITSFLGFLNVLFNINSSLPETTGAKLPNQFNAFPFYFSSSRNYRFLLITCILVN